jgi:hypothetical protein
MSYSSRPAKSLSLLAAFFRFLYVAIVVVNTLNHFVPPILLAGARSFTAFNNGQLQDLALASLRLHGTGYVVGLVFFGFHCMLVGILISRSTFLPRILGWLMAIAGLCYLTNSFANSLSPPLQGHLYPYILLPGLVAELSLCLWLLAVGVNVQRWFQQASLDFSRARCRSG